jgi:hypothetical protein
VRVIIHPDRSSVLVQAPAEVIIKMKDGRKISGEMFTIGSRQEPLTTSRYVELYSKLAGGILSNDQINKTAETLLNLEKLSDVKDSMNTLTFRQNV